MEKEVVLILDFGNHNNQILARKVRESNVYCEIIPYNTDVDKIKDKKPKGFILTGNSPNISQKDISSAESNISTLDLPILDLRDQGETLPEMNTIQNFLYDTCSCSKDWTVEAFTKEAIENLKDKIGDKKVLCGLSGGVDSSVAAVMISKAVGKQLTCIFVDHGLLRKNEGDEVEKIFSKKFDLNFIRVNAQERFYNKLAGVTDPEEKRKIIGEEFIRVFEEEAKKIGKVDYLVQGTIYPDLIESGVGGDMVKSHHNVGGLPDHVDFKEIIEPLSSLFKDEVRKVGLELGLPASLVNRQPFPGPGLAIRIIGDITPEKIAIVQEADHIFRGELSLAGLDKEISQCFAVLTNIKSVGVTDGKRTYDYTVALRAVKTIDFMSAEFAQIPWDVLGKVSTRIVNEVDHVNRVCYDVTGKPPATIEWE